MLKRDITYEDYNGNEVTETFYFNLNQTEIVELEISKEGGLKDFIQRIIETKDAAQLINEFKKIILKAYGQKSEDGKRFIKNDQLREEFSQTAAYDALFMDLAFNETSAADFIKGVIPSALRGQLETIELPQAGSVISSTPPTTSQVVPSVQPSSPEEPIAWPPPSDPTE